MMVPKNEVWIRKVSETNAYRAGRVPGSDGWSARMVPENEWSRKTRLGSAGRVPESDAWDGRMVTGKRGFECRNICRKISLDRSVDIRN